MNNGQFTSPSELDYLELLSLRCAPFENRIDPAFFYGGTALMQRLDLLTHLTQFGESLVVVSGPPGSGKTTLIGQFAAHVNSRWHLCLLHGNDIDQLPAELARALGGADASTGTDALLGRWDTETDASQLFVIAVDDAEQLEPDACEALCGLLQKPQSERLRILLFGSAELQPLLKQTLTKLGSARTPQLLEVPRLSDEETAAYLMYRLAVAGYSGESPFSATEIRGICKAADGWPGAINQYADHALQEQAVRARSKQTPPRKKVAIPFRFAPLAIVMGVILTTYAGWQLFFSATQENDQSTEIQLAGNEKPLTLPLPAPLDKSKEPPEQALTTDANDTEEPSPAQQDTSVAAEPAAKSLAPAPAPDQHLAPEHESVPAPPARPPQQETVSAEATVTSSPAAEKPAESAPPPAPSPAPEPVPHREAWLLAQPDDHFSLQLLGSRQEKSVTTFIARHKLDLKQTAYYRGLHKGSEWFVLMYGLYPSREAALQGVAGLPAAVRKAKPWPRTLQAVQQSIREAGS